MAFDPHQDFVILDDGSPSGARLFSRPHKVVRADAADQIAPALAELRAATSAGNHVAGYLAYEAASAFEPRIAAHLAGPAPQPLLWFGVFAKSEMIDLDKDARRPAFVRDVCARITEKDYAQAIAQIQKLIAAGDIYQANYTFDADIDFEGHPLDLFLHLRARQRAPYAALIHHDKRWILSFSPELFFEIRNGKISAKPMKGTAPRGSDQQDDESLRLALQQDSKNRAENLMITDLLRNDLARVARAGSVEVPALFHVESYPTVHQMTSTITADLAADKDIFDALAALFPCGSVTGAPKIRAMEVIGAIEQRPRGLYTGSIGHITPEGEGCFNVVIRTLETTDGSQRARMGLGSGIVADSVAQAEWRECLEKAQFLTTSVSGFDLIETMRCEPDVGIVHLKAHLARLAASAARFGMDCDMHKIRNHLAMAIAGARTPRRVRLLLGRRGGVSVESQPLAPNPQGPVGVKIVPLPVPVQDLRLRHKTTDRSFYDSARTASGAFEVIFLRPDGFLTEGSFTNIFLPQGERLATPPASDSLLPGILRGHLLAQGRAFEQRLRPEDLAGGFQIGNALRGLIDAHVVA